MSYDRVVAAALAETSSKFRLAEALALDIPRRRRGGDAANRQNILAELEDARLEVIEAGGEPRSIRTLDTYRSTALWVESATIDGGTFRWIPGVSFTAHSAAREAGMSYEQFAEMPVKTIDAVNQHRPGWDGVSDGHGHRVDPPAEIARGWSPEQKAEAVQEILADPDVADRVMSDDDTRERAMGAVVRSHERDNLHRPRPEPRTEPDLSNAAYQSEMSGVFVLLSYCRRKLNEAAETLQASPFIHSEPTYQDGVRAGLIGLSNRIDIITGIVDGKSMDDALDELLSGGDAA